MYTSFFIQYNQIQFGKPNLKSSTSRPLHAPNHLVDICLTPEKVKAQ